MHGLNYQALLLTKESCSVFYKSVKGFKFIICMILEIKELDLSEHIQYLT